MPSIGLAARRPSPDHSVPSPPARTEDVERRAARVIELLGCALGLIELLGLRTVRSVRTVRNALPSCFEDGIS